MNGYIKTIIIIITLICCNSIVDAGVEKISPGKKISIEMETLPSNIKPGAKPITLSGDILKELFPELKNPRLMKLGDLDSSFNEQEDFIEGGFTFVLRGDFNRDGIADIAFVGKYDNSEKQDENSFIAILSVKGKKVLRIFFSKIYKKKISLVRVINYRPNIDAIGMTYIIPSEDCGYLFWSGKNWYYDDECKD